MRVHATIAEARKARERQSAGGRSVALVPTMGALHTGHLSLVEAARPLADEIWVSIFVNPAQFGPGEDLERYPRDLEADLEKLRGAGVNHVFAPTAEEMYPRPPVVEVGFSGLENRLCGSDRPGHFAGVGLVVAKLFNIIQPHAAVFGQKDAQQALLIRRLAEDLDFAVRIVVSPTIREHDGLAMSSRNTYLSADERAAALALSRGLDHAEEAILDGETDPSVVAALLRREIEAEDLLQLDYGVCVTLDRLDPPARIDGPVLLAVAARAGDTRLIDNHSVTPPPTADEA